MEPDAKVIQALQQNRDTHNGKFHIFNGAVSQTPVVLVDHDNVYARYTQPDGHGTPVESITMKELESKYNLTFDVLVADCEGALEKFVDDNKDALSKFRVFIYEKDRPDGCNYEAIEGLLRTWGFSCVESETGGFHVVWTRSDNKGK